LLGQGRVGSGPRAPRRSLCLTVSYLSTPTCCLRCPRRVQLAVPLVRRARGLSLYLSMCAHVPMAWKGLCALQGGVCAGCGVPRTGFSPLNRPVVERRPPQPPPPVALPTPTPRTPLTYSRNSQSWEACLRFASFPLPARVPGSPPERLFAFACFLGVSVCGLWCVCVRAATTNASTGLSVANLGLFNLAGGQRRAVAVGGAGVVYIMALHPGNSSLASTVMTIGPPSPLYTTFGGGGPTNPEH
jgi:hypothetical protein